MSDKTFDPNELRQFTGTEHWYKHGLTSIVYTDGVAYVAESADAHWLLDEIAINQTRRAVNSEEFQVWKLTVTAENAGTLTCDDGNGNIVFSKAIEYTDFPAPEIKLYFYDNTILLPSEY